MAQKFAVLSTVNLQTKYIKESQDYNTNTTCIVFTWQG